MARSMQNGSCTRCLNLMLSHTRQAIRQLSKNRGFTVVSLLTLALAIGVNTTAFTVLNRMLLQRSPYPQPDRLVQVIRTSPQGQDMAHSPGDFLDEHARNKSFGSVAAYSVNVMGNLVVPGHVAQQATAISTSADYFTVTGVAPAVGRGYSADDVAHHSNVVVLSNAFWQKQFAGDLGIIGRTIRFDGIVETVIGVMPRALDDPMIYGRTPDLWKLDDLDENRNLRDKNWYSVLGRLRPGVSLVQARAELGAIAAGLAIDYPKTDAGQGLRVEYFHTGSQFAKITWLIMELNLVVLLIACVNLGNLQLARNTGRTREFAIRLALGSSRGRLIGMLLLETLLMSLAGGALGLLVGDWVSAGIAASLGIAMPLNIEVVTFTFGIASVTPAIFGALPAWIASRADLNSAFRLGARNATADRSRHQLRRVLIVGQLAMTLMLLTATGFFIRGLQKLTHDMKGWSPEHLLVGGFALTHERYGEDGDPRSTAFGARFIEGLQQLPGVEQATIMRSFPSTGPGSTSGFLVDGQPIPPKGKEPIATPNWVSPGYFSTFGIHIEQGRDFSGADRSGAPRVAIISHSMARKFWPGENPIGKRIGDPDSATRDWCEVVGVVADIDGLGDSSPVETHYELYRPWAQDSLRFIVFAVRAKGEPAVLAESAGKVLGEMEPDVAIAQMGTMDQILATNLSSVNVARQGLIDVALLGLVLSFAGIYGLIASMASERTQEVGIRMALGAQSGDVLWLFLRNGIRLAIAGIGIGVLLSCGLMVALTKVVGVLPGNDPFVLIAVTLLLAAVSLLACWLPALRATRVDPNVALRTE
jgi:predicted permease